MHGALGAGGPRPRCEDAARAWGTRAGRAQVNSRSSHSLSCDETTAAGYRELGEGAGVTLTSNRSGAGWEQDTQRFVWLLRWGEQ